MDSGSQAAVQEGVHRRTTARNPNLLILLSGQAVSQVGNSLFAIALYWMTLTMTHSRFALAMVAMLGGIAGVTGILAGPLLDRWDRRRTMIWSDAVRLVLSAALGILALTSRLDFPVIIVLTLALRVAGAIFLPSEMALLPKIVSEQELPSANGALQAVGAAANLGGTGFGGVLLGVMGPVGLFLLNAGSFAASLISLYFLQTEREAAKRTKTSGAAGTVPQFLHELREGWQVIRSHPVLRRFITVSLLLNFASVSVTFLDVAWVQQVLHAGAVAYGLLNAALVAGVIGGSLLASVLVRRFGELRVITAGIILSGIALVAFALLPYLGCDLALFALLGVSLGALEPTALTAVQRATPAHVMGRVMGALMTMGSLAVPLGALLAGSLASAAPLWVTFGAAGMLMGLASLPLIGITSDLKGLGTA